MKESSKMVKKRKKWQKVADSSKNGQKSSILAKNIQKQSKTFENGNFYQKTSYLSLNRPLINLQRFCAIIAIRVLHNCWKCDRVILMKKAHRSGERKNRTIDFENTLNEKGSLLV